MATVAIVVIIVVGIVGMVIITIVPVMVPVGIVPGIIAPVVIPVIVPRIPVCPAPVPGMPVRTVHSVHMPQTRIIIPGIVPGGNPIPAAHIPRGIAPGISPPGVVIDIDGYGAVVVESNGSGLTLRQGQGIAISPLEEKF